MDNRTTDQVLDGYFSAQQSTQLDELGELLASRAEPIIRKVVFRRITESAVDAEDVCADATLNLMVHLQRCRESQDPNPIRNFDNYAAATAHHACDQYLRRKHPSVWRLRNQIRYLLENDPKLAVWRNQDGVVVCGFVSWQTHRAESALGHSDIGQEKHLRLRQLLLRIFRNSPGPVDLNTVVEQARSATGLLSRFTPDSEEIEQLADKTNSVEKTFEQRTYAAELWKEIQELPLRQRSALLLNLKDDAVNLLLLTGVASFRQIAAALEIEPEALASLWPDLPLDDMAIARQLGCTRQQIINLRMAARKRLANRMAGWS